MSYKNYRYPLYVAVFTSLFRCRYSRLAESRSVTPSPPLHEHNLTEFSMNDSNVPPTLTEATPSQPSSDPVKLTRPRLLNIPSMFSRRNGNLTDEQKAEKLKNSVTTPSPGDLKPIFEAESPDELALVGAAYTYDCKLLKRTPNYVSLSILHEGVIDYEILNVLPFDSFRKCMSVIVRHPDTKEIILYCKGADSTIFER